MTRSPQPPLKRGDKSDAPQPAATPPESGAEPTAALATIPPPQDLYGWLYALDSALIALGWATAWTSERTGRREQWEVKSPRLLPGLKAAARQSLIDDGHEPAVADAVVADVPESRQFWLYRSLLNDRALKALALRFEKAAQEV